MTRRYLHWCPNGCGKRVIFEYKKTLKNGFSVYGFYECKNCKGRFTKEEVEDGKAHKNLRKRKSM